MIQPVKWPVELDVQFPSGRPRCSSASSMKTQFPADIRRSQLQFGRECIRRSFPREDESTASRIVTAPAIDDLECQASDQSGTQPFRRGIVAGLQLFPASYLPRTAKWLILSDSIGTITSGEFLGRSGLADEEMFDVLPENTPGRDVAAVLSDW